MKRQKGDANIRLYKHISLKERKATKPKGNGHYLSDVTLRNQDPIKRVLKVQDS